MLGCGLTNDGGVPSTTVLALPSAAAAGQGVGGIAADDHVLAYFDVWTDGIWRVNLPGSTSLPLDNTHQSEWNVVLDGKGGVFWTADISGYTAPAYIASDTVDGGMLFQPVTGNSNVVATSAGVFLNVTDGPPSGAGLIRVSPDGGYTPLAAPSATNHLSSLVSLSVDAENVYWTPYDGPLALWMVSKAGGPAWPVTGIVSNQNVARTAAFGSTFYWLDINAVMHWIPIVDGGAGIEGSFNLWTCNLPLDGAADLAVDGSGIYLLLGLQGRANMVVRLRPDAGTLEQISPSSIPAIWDTHNAGFSKSLAVNSSTVFWVCQIGTDPPTVCSSPKPP